MSAKGQNAIGLRESKKGKPLKQNWKGIKVGSGTMTRADGSNRMGIPSDIRLSYRGWISFTLAQGIRYEQSQTKRMEK